MGRTNGRIAAAVLLLAGVAGAGGLAAAGGEGRTNLVEVPSRFDGIVLLIATEVREGEKVPAEKVVTVRHCEEVTKYRRLQVGDTVEVGNVLARLDDLLVRDELALKTQKVAAGEAEWKAAVTVRDEAEQRYRVLERLSNGSGSRLPTLEDLRGAKYTWDRYWYEEITKKAALETAKLEVKSAELRLGLHAIRSPVRGTIAKLYKHPGEAVRAYEPLVEVRIAPGRGE